MRITYFASRIDLRVERFALYARETGHEVQLCAPHGSSFTISSPGDYKNIIFYSPTQESYSEIYTHIQKYNPKLLHMFMHWTENKKGLLFSSIKNIPTIGDSYDMVNAQYILSPRSNYSREAFYERHWMKNIDGFTLRSPYYDTIKNINKNIFTLLLSDPLNNTLYNLYSNKYSRYDKKIHILYCIDRYLAEGSPKILIPILQASQRENIYFHILEWPSLCTPSNLKELLLKKYSNITFVPFLPYNCFCRLLGKCDICIQNTDIWDTLAHENIYKKEAAPFFFSHKINDCIENNTIFMSPAIHTYIHKYTKKFHRSITFTDENLVSPDFWNRLSDKIEELYSVDIKDILAAKIKKYQEALSSFYSKIASL